VWDVIKVDEDKAKCTPPPEDVLGRVLAEEFRVCCSSIMKLISGCVMAPNLTEFGLRSLRMLCNKLLLTSLPKVMKAGVAIIT